MRLHRSHSLALLQTSNIEYFKFGISYQARDLFAVVFSVETYNLDRLSNLSEKFHGKARAAVNFSDIKNKHSVGLQYVAFCSERI